MSICYVCLMPYANGRQAAANDASTILMYFFCISRPHMLSYMYILLVEFRYIIIGYQTSRIGA